MVAALLAAGADPTIENMSDKMPHKEAEDEEGTMLMCLELVDGAQKEATLALLRDAEGADHEDEDGEDDEEKETNEEF